MTNKQNEQSNLLPKEHITSHLHHAAAHGSIRHLHEKVPIYNRPKQLQRWDETQTLPHVNWGDLYFDLFYVAAAFQLSHAFKDEPTMEGLFYFVACYLSIFAIWNEKLSFDAKFVCEDDIFHRFMEILNLCLVGACVAHIQPAEVMKNTTSSPDMFIFCVAVACSSAWLLYLYWDVKNYVYGGPEAKYDGKMQINRKLIGFVCQVMAATIAGRDYYGSIENHEDEAGNRLPAYLLIMAFVGETILYQPILVFIVIPSMKKSHKEFNVPLNVEFMIHRIGEWVMLMLGESVLSLLTLEHTQDIKGKDLQYSVSFFSGLVTVTFFQYLFFRTQPTEARDHALRRSQAGGFLYFYAHIFYSAALILMGCSYKMILLSFSQADDEMRERIACVFCWSMTVSFISLDCLIISHRGCLANFSRLCPNRKCAWIPSLCSLLLVGSWGFTISMSYWVPNLETLSVLGLLVVSFQVLVRTVGLRYFPVTKDAMERAVRGDYEGSKDNHRWPNTTEARVEHHSDDAHV